MTSQETPPPSKAPDVSAESSWDQPEQLLADRDGDALNVDVGGFEGPLDLLLALARTQKVDLASISILALAEQYLAFISEAQRLRLKLAADYLVMAAWLAFLKSKLLLPREEEADEVASAEEMAQRLAFRLKRLEAMRERAAQLMTRSRLGRDVFGRGMPEKVKAVRQRVWGADVNDLLQAYASARQKAVRIVHTVRARKVWSVKEARGHLQRVLGEALPGAWAEFDRFLLEFLPVAEEETRTVRASSFGATLEMAREGLVELRQNGPFQPIYMRRLEDTERERVE